MSSACRSATCSVDMARPDPWLEHYGAARGGPRARSPAASPLALAALAVIVAAVADRARPARPRWQPPRGVGFHACTHGDRVDARCAQLRVPADASRPEGRTISLHVAVIPATRQPARGALFYLEGGPGGVATDAAVKVDEMFANVSEYRDLVLVDQRGTGRSHALVCPQEHVRATDAAAVAAYFRRCFARLGGEARHAHERGRGRRHRARPAGARLRAGSTSSAAPTAPRWRSSTLSRHPGSVRTVDARRRLALEHPGVRAGRAQRRARAARRHRPLSHAANGVPARVSAHRGRAGAPAGRRTRGAPTGSR